MIAENIEFDLKMGKKDYKHLKSESVKISKKLYHIGMKARSKKILYCSDVIRYQYFYKEGIKRKIAAVHFCKDMFCPICSKRKSMKQGAQLYKECEKLEGKGYGFVGLTLTLKSMHNAEKMRKKLWDSWRDLRRRKVLSFMSGAYSSLEVTYNKEAGYHFHMHVLIATKLKLPLSKVEYRLISDRISEEWLDITEDSFITKIQGVSKKNQFTKYITKVENILDMEDEVLRELLKCMKGKKTFSKTGVFRGIQLEEIGDIEEEKDEEFIAFEVYKWNKERECYDRYFEDEYFKEITEKEVIERIRKIKEKKRRGG